MTTAQKAALVGLLKEAEEKCGGIFTDFQISESYHVELTLTVKELRDLKQIFEPRLRKRILEEELSRLIHEADLSEEGATEGDACE